MLKSEAVQGSIEGFHIEDELKESGKGFQTLFNLMPDPAVVVDGKGKFLAVNDKVEEKTGFKREELLGKNFLKTKIVTTKSKALLTKTLAKVMTGKEVGLYKIEALTKDGRRIPAEGTAAIITYMGKPAVMAVVRDITERKRAEEALRESEEKHRNLLENARDTVMALDLNGNITFVNRVVEEYGFKKDEIIGKSMTEFVPEKCQPKLIKEFVEVIQGKSAEGEIEIITPKGKMISEYRSSPIRRGNEVIGSQTILRDITERKKMENALRRSEEKFRSIFESASDCMIFLNRSGRILDVNRKAVEVFGGSKKELLGKHFSRVGVVSPRDIPRIMTAVAKGLAGKKATLNVCIKNKKSQEIGLECSNSLLKIDGKFVGLLVIARDVSERKKAEEQLRESEERYKVLVESAADAIFTLNEAGDFLSANQEAAKSMGKTPEDMIGKNMYDLFPKDAADRQMSSVKAIFQTGKPLLAYEALTQTEYGQRWYSTTLMPVRDSDDKIIYVMGSSRDITERKLMEKKLEEYSERLEELVQKRTKELLESEKRYSVLVEEARDAVAILQDGKVVFTNKKGTEIFEYSRDELIGLPFEKIVDKKYLPLVKERYMQRLRGEEVPPTYEIEVVAKSGERIPIEISATLINHQGRPADLVIARDIRERKRLEEERLNLERLATIGEIATMVGHDLRNPLQAITNAVYILKNYAITVDSALTNERYVKILDLVPESFLGDIRQKIEKAVEQRNKTIHTIDESVKYANKIVSDLHDFAKTKELRLTKVDLESLIQDSLLDISTPKNVKILIRNDQRLPKLHVDPDQIKRVFTNLTTNAIQAMPNGGKLTISTSLNNDIASIRFQDTGTGIPKETMKKLFTPFFTTRAKGMGMGLAVCKRLVDAHGGTIEVESQEGKGSTFTIKLPNQKNNGGEKA